MKPWIGLSFIVLTTAGCNSTRVPAYEDAIDAGSVRGGTQRSGEAAPRHSTYEDAIDAGSVDPGQRRSSSRTGKPSKYEDAIDAGHAISALPVPETERELAAARVDRVLTRSRA